MKGRQREDLLCSLTKRYSIPTAVNALFSRGSFVEGGTRSCSPHKPRTARDISSPPLP